MSVIVAEAAARGACELPIGAIAARAGVCATVVRRALRQGRALGLLDVEHRRIRYDRSQTNRVTVASAELRLWMRTRARVSSEMADLPKSIKHWQGGGCTKVLPTSNHLLTSSARPAAAAWKPGLAMGGTARYVPGRWALRPPDLDRRR